MSIPANALSDEECLHYTALDPAVAAELTRRLTSQCIDPGSELNELREQVRLLENAAESSESEAEDLREEMEAACGWIKRAMDPEDRDISLNALLKKALDCLE